MKSGFFVLSLLASVALAQPHKQHRHQHQARHQVIEWVTEWAVETEVVAVTETVWVPEGYVAPTTLSTSASTTSSKKVPAQFFQPVSKSKSSSPAPSSSSVYVAPPPVSTTPVEPAPAPPAPSTTPVVEISTSTTSAPPAPSSEPVQAQIPEPKVEPVAAPTSAAAAPTSATGDGSSGGACSKGNACTGDITHYDAGLGACGWETNGESENVVALSHLLMGTQSNGNVFCGKSVTITLNGKTTTAKVVDKCMGCEPHDLDLSNKAFKELEDMAVGRTQASWYFN